MHTRTHARTHTHTRTHDTCTHTRNTHTHTHTLQTAKDWHLMLVIISITGVGALLLFLEEVVPPFRANLALFSHLENPQGRDVSKVIERYSLVLSIFKPTEAVLTTSGNQRQSKKQHMYVYPVVKLLLSYAKIINPIQYLLGGTVLFFWHCPGDM